MTILSLSNKKQISVKTINGEKEVSIALQIPIRNQEAVNELIKRQERILKLFPKHQKKSENPKQFRIHIQLACLKASQIESFITVYQEVIAANPQFSIYLTTCNGLVGEQAKSYPVVSVYSEDLKKLFLLLQHKLHEQGINTQKPTELVSFVSLFASPFEVNNKVQLDNSDNQLVNFSGELGLAHINEKSAYQALVVDDLRELGQQMNLSKETAFSTISACTFMQFMRDNAIRAIAGFLIVAGITAIVCGTCGVAGLGMTLTYAGTAVLGAGAILAISGLFAKCRKDPSTINQFNSLAMP